MYTKINRNTGQLCTFYSRRVHPAYVFPAVRMRVCVCVIIIIYFKNKHAAFVIFCFTIHFYQRIRTKNLSRKKVRILFKQTKEEKNEFVISTYDQFH